MKDTVVLYPGLAVSHFVPMMQLADVLLEDGYNVIVVLMNPDINGGIAFASIVDRIVSMKPSINFHMLPMPQNLPDTRHDAIGYFDLVSCHNQHLLEFLSSISTQTLRAVIIDTPSIGALDVTKILKIPAYTFFGSNASALAVTHQLPWIRKVGQPSFMELGNTLLNFHGVPPMPASHLISEMLLDPESELYKVMMNALCRTSEASGVLVNTFASLEPRVMRVLRDPQCLPMMPPVYCVGPLVAKCHETIENNECLEWLDKQPDRSVVFLCFGSVGADNHTEQQLKEIANGLEMSGHRFLWVVRAPPFQGSRSPSKPHGDPDLNAILPGGFLERTSGRGLIIKQWAPQVDVLHHKATGAFMTHCGWNSVLEAIMAGVPMLCWPLYAEQKMNKVFMVEEAGIGVEMVGWQKGLVKANEVQAKVRLVMETKKGNQLRARVMSHMEAATMAWKDGGQSRVAFSQFLLDAAKFGHGRNEDEDSEI